MGVLVWEGEIRQVTHPVIGPDICIPKICHHYHHPVLRPGFWRLTFLASLAPHIWISEPHRLEYGKCRGIWESDSH